MLCIHWAFSPLSSSPAADAPRRGGWGGWGGGGGGSVIGWCRGRRGQEMKSYCKCSGTCCHLLYVPVRVPRGLLQTDGSASSLSLTSARSRHRSGRHRDRKQDFQGFSRIKLKTTTQKILLVSQTDFSVWVRNKMIPSVESSSECFCSGSQIRNVLFVDALQDWNRWLMCALSLTDNSSGLFDVSVSFTLNTSSFWLLKKTSAVFSLNDSFSFSSERTEATDLFLKKCQRWRTNILIRKTTTDSNSCNCNCNCNCRITTGWFCSSVCKNQSSRLKFISKCATDDKSFHQKSLKAESFRMFQVDKEILVL